MEEQQSRYVLLDRDGVINLRSTDGYAKCWEKFEFLPRALPALRLLATNHFTTVVISRRNSVGAGLQSARDLEAITRRFLLEVAISGGHITKVYYCRHRIEDACNCYGPSAGLILHAMAELKFPSQETYFIGETDYAMEAGLAAGCTCVRIQRDAFLQPTALAEGPYRVISSLYEAAEQIVEESGSPDFEYAAVQRHAANAMQFREKKPRNTGSREEIEIGTNGIRFQLAKPLEPTTSKR